MQNNGFALQNIAHKGLERVPEGLKNDKMMPQTARKCIFCLQTFAGFAKKNVLCRRCAANCSHRSKHNIQIKPKDQAYRETSTP